MRALILTDESFLSREPDMLRRLEIGLTGEGVSVMHAMPDTAADLAEAGLFARTITYPTRTPWFMERWRMRQLRDAMILADEDLPGANGQVDLIHVFGEGAWGLGARLAREQRSPLILEVWSAGIVEKAAALASSMPPDLLTTLLAPDPHIEQALRREDGSLVVRGERWGVHTPAQPNAAPEASQAIGVMVIGEGQSDSGFIEAFEGVCRAAKRQARMLIFADADGVARSNAWNLAEQAGVLEKLTLVPRMEGARSLVLRGSVLVCPEASGEQRTIVLDAMAHAMAVVAMRDPMVSYLKDGQTAHLVSRPAAEEWATAIEVQVVDRTQARQLGEAARSYVSANHRVSTHVATVLDVYERVVSGESLPFPVSADGDSAGR